MIANKKYSVIYADPPWKFNNRKTGGSMSSGATQKYKTMSLNEMVKMDVESICDDDCLLVMWWVGSMGREAEQLANAWGFRVVTLTGFVWNKLTSQGNPFFGMGHTTRAGAECALIGVRGKLKNLIKSKSVRSVRTEVVGRHSEKPDVFRLDIEKLCGDVPRLEMFARKPFHGWDFFGNETGVEIGVKSDG